MCLKLEEKLVIASYMLRISKTYEDILFLTGNRIHETKCLPQCLNNFQSNQGKLQGNTLAKVEKLQKLEISQKNAENCKHRSSLDRDFSCFKTKIK